MNGNVLHLPPNLLNSFLVIDVRDPDELGDDSSVSRRFPSNNNSHRYRLRRAPPAANSAAKTPGVLTRLAMCSAGGLMAAYIADRYATEVRIDEPGTDRFCVSKVLAKSLTLHTVGGHQVMAGGDRGLVLRGEPGTRFQSSDDNARFNLWVDAPRVDNMLAALLGNAPARRLEFQPSADFSAGAGASLMRLLELFAHELAQPDGLASNPLALNCFTDLWVQTMLNGLPHNHRDAMASRHHGAPVPRHIKRAEDFMRENVARPINLGAIAEAAGCSLRTLHVAFRRFRDTTPLAALQGIRLDAVRAMLAAGGEALKPSDVARLYGFTNAGRFKVAYLNRFGAPPPGSPRG